MTAILITQCLQNDFVQPIGRGEPLPNLLHVGAEEARRLLGEKPEEGPVARIIDWAYNQPREELTILHLRDWHDVADGFEQQHLHQFGDHCLAGTPGAEFVFREPEGSEDRARVVNGLTLNDFHGTDLESILDPLVREGAPIGIIGVWTEAKVLFLAYELRTRYPEASLAVCSALTAGSSRTSHFLALEQMTRILQVNVFSSVGEFQKYLGGEESQSQLETDSKYPEIAWVDTADMEDPDEDLLRYLFRDCRLVSFTPLGGGYSGNPVFLAESLDTFGHQQAPHVVKIGPQDSIGRERTAFEQIQSVLGNSAPQIADFADHLGRGGLKYRYASMGKGDSTTFQRLYMSGIPREKVESLLETVFMEQLGRLYAAAVRENVDLLDYYGFRPDWAPGVRQKVENLIGPSSQERTLIFPGARVVENVCLFYEVTLRNRPARGPDNVYVAFVHGDLNGANIVVDERENVWLIDFVHTHRGHVLNDLIKLENDLLYIFTPIESKKEFEEALELTDILLDQEDLAEPLPSLDQCRLESPAMQRAYRTILFLRSLYPRLIREDTNILQLLIGQLRYAVHTLSFDESSDYQKKWALYTACRCAEEATDLIGGKKP